MMIFVATASAFAGPPTKFSPNPGHDNILTGVKTLSLDDALAVGYYCKAQCVTGQDGRGMILHWNGSAWSRVKNPNPGTEDRLLSVTGVSKSDVWAAGIFHNASFSECGPLFEHWNGTSWKQVSSPFQSTCDQVFSIDEVSAKNVWAVGDDVTTTVIVHWNGTAWSQVPSPTPSKVANFLLSVSAFSATNIWAAGYYCKSGCSSPREVDAPLLLHWNGTAWSKTSAPGSKGSEMLRGVEAVTGKDAWAVGTINTNQSVILHWNGTRWSNVKAPNVFDLNQTAFVSASNGWAFGAGLNPLHWNGTRWSQVTVPSLGGAVAGSARSARNVWAVGSFCSGGGCNTNNYHTLTMHWNGRSWSRH